MKYKPARNPPPFTALQNIRKGALVAFNLENKEVSLIKTQDDFLAAANDEKVIAANSPVKLKRGKSTRKFNFDLNQRINNSIDAIEHAQRIANKIPDKNQKIKFIRTFNKAIKKQK